METGISKDYVNKLLEENSLGVLDEPLTPLDYRILYALQQAYRDGYIDALRNFAVWKDGEQVTAMGRNVKDLIKGLEKETVPIKY